MRHRCVVRGLAVGAVLILALPALAAPGRLDRSFGGGDGMVTNDFGGSSASGRGVLVLPSGKILQVGRANVGGDNDFAVARYKPGGRRDNSFGGDGRIATDFFGGDDGAWAIARYGRRKFVVAGWASPGGGDYHFALARYNANGSLDDSFGGDGKVTTPFPNQGFAYDVLVLPDRSIVAAGEDLINVSPYPDDFALAKYRPNGNPDNSFDNDGVVITDFFGGSDWAFDVIPQGNRLLVAGYGSDGPEPSDNDVALARYRMTGTLDGSFSGDGKHLIQLHATLDDGGEQMVTLPDGRIVIAATSGTDVALVRIHPGGGLDSSFGGGDGVVIRDFGGNERVHGLVRYQRKLIAGGYSADELDQALWRFRRGGGVDTGFGGDGEAVSKYPSFAFGFEIARQGDTVLISGSAGTDMALSRFLLN